MREFGLHGTLRVLLFGINGTRDLVVQLTRKALATIARTILRPISDEARVAAKICTRASLMYEKANGKEKVRMVFVAAIHFMRNRGWEKVIDACLQHLGVGNIKWEKTIVSWYVVGECCKHVCAFTWRLAWFSGADVGRLRRHSIAMGTAHNEPQRGKLPWTYLWIDHTYSCAMKWRILSSFPCFAMEGSH